MKNNTAILGLFFCVLLACWGLGILKVVVASLPYNPISLSKKARINQSILIPQGWAFFTKDPREPYVAIYKENQGRLQLAVQPNASASNYFGALRLTRAMGVEMGALANQVSAHQWFACTQSLQKCFKQNDLPSLSIINKAHDPQFCGEYFLSLEEPVPWAWAKDYETVELPCQLVKINVICL